MPLNPAPIVISDSVHRILLKFSKKQNPADPSGGTRKNFYYLCGWTNNLQISERVSIGQDSVNK